MIANSVVIRSRLASYNLPKMTILASASTSASLRGSVPWRTNACEVALPPPSITAKHTKPDRHKRVMANFLGHSPNGLGEYNLLLAPEWPIKHFPAGAILGLRELYALHEIMAVFPGKIGAAIRTPPGRSLV